MTPERRHDPAALADRRRLADTLRAHELCPDRSCQRLRRCTGPIGTTRAFPGEGLPACLADGFEAMYGPVARWNDLMRMIAAVEAAGGDGPDGARGR